MLGIPTMTIEQEREWVERMRSGLGAFPSQNPRTGRGESKPNHRKTNPVVRSTSREAGRKALSAMYRRELHASLPRELKEWLQG